MIWLESTSLYAIGKKTTTTTTVGNDMVHLRGGITNFDKIFFSYSHWSSTNHNAKVFISVRFSEPVANWGGFLKTNNIFRVEPFHVLKLSKQKVRTRKNPLVFEEKTVIKALDRVSSASLSSKSVWNCISIIEKWQDIEIDAHSMCSHLAESKAADWCLIDKQGVRRTGCQWNTRLANAQPFVFDFSLVFFSWGRRSSRLKLQGCRKAAKF